MAITAAELAILISARDAASPVLNKVAGKTGVVGGALGKLGGIMGGPLKVGAIAGVGAIGLLGGALATSIKEAMEAQKVQAQLVAVLKSTKGAAGLTKKALLDMAAAFQKETTFSDEAVLSAENLLLTFTQIKGPLMKQATQAVLDMSTALGTDLQGSALQVGKALNDPILGMTALRRVGVSFTSEQVAVIKKLQETGQTAKAQQMIIQELNKEFGGSASAAADTFGGRMTQLKNAIGEVQESIGMALLPILQKLAEKLSGWLSTHQEDIQKVIDKWVAFAQNEAFPAIVQFLKDAKGPAEDWFALFRVGLEDIKKVFLYVIDNQVLLIAALTAVGAAVVLAFGPASAAAVAIAGIITAIGLIDVKLGEIYAGIEQKRQEDLSGWERFMIGLRTELEGAGRAIDAILTGKWGEAWRLFGGLVAAIWRGTLIALDTSFRGWVLIIKTELARFVSDVWANLKFLGKVFDAVFGPFGITIRGIGNTVGWLIDQIEALIGVLKKVKFPSLPGWIGGLGGLGGVLGGVLGKHAAGGTIRTPLSLVGERGPELLGPAAMGSRVFSNAQSRQMLAGAGTAGGGGGGGGQAQAQAQAQASGMATLIEEIRQLRRDLGREAAIILDGREVGRVLSPRFAGAAALIGRGG